MTKIVTIGGGTGTFTVLSGLKQFPEVSLSAIVTTADDGGSTGHLRDAYGFLPAGDARQALVALAEDGNVLRDLFAYRFSKSEIKGHNLGNLFITALTDLLGSDAAALEEASKILRINGAVISASDQSATLVAKLSDGTEVSSEHLIDSRVAGRARIVELSYAQPVPISAAARRAIEESDVIILGPGDLYTSTAAALLPTGMREALATSRAKLIYVMNLFTKAGQTDGYKASAHVAEIARYAGRHPDHVVLNDGSFPENVLAYYAEEGECPVENDLIGNEGQVNILSLASVQTAAKVEGDALPRSLIRHDVQKLAQALHGLFS